MLAILIALYCVASVLVLLGVFTSAARVMPRPNRRGGRLGRWLKFHNALK